MHTEFNDGTRSLYLFLEAGLLQWRGPDNWVLDLSPEYPVWPVNAVDGEQPLSSLQIGDYIRCPMDPIGHSPLRIVGMNGKPYGFVCEECNAIYTTTDLALPMDSVPVRSEETVYA
ncbi:hypothetical protein [Burkholderia pseudomallei]|uniref:hypothetical protein n=1 Tax=Burkholderia pseudomallei TaxID=28450 RepID=UPI0021F73A4C|nr:hypothetical protein [Burkholderia pseudomallei]MCV9913156.1 hypothetical protein [Burkholderia pseudomallei]MCV9970697.1 hypothetical protein [Burkholderia pseudomallei]MCW0069588.1 hypothetical protein [Burkholderia pseudomallei]